MKISIAMAVYNGAPYIARQLQSFLEQSRLPNELVICDDHSGDESIREIEKTLAKAPFDLKLTVNPHNLGYAQNFGQALAACTGDLIFLSDQDDVWLPDKLAVMETLAENDPAGLMFLHDAAIVHEDLRPAGVTKLGQLRSAGLSQSYFITGSCSAVRRRLLEAVLPIPPGFGSHDTWLARFAEGVGRKRVLDKTLQLHRRHGGNTTRYFANSTRRTHHYQKYLERLRRVREQGGGDIARVWDRLQLVRGRALEWLGAETDPALLTALQHFVAELEADADALLHRMELRKLDRLGRMIQGAKLLRAGGYQPASGFVSYLRDII